MASFRSNLSCMAVALVAGSCAPDAHQPLAESQQIRPDNRHRIPGGASRNEINDEIVRVAKSGFEPGSAGIHVLMPSTEANSGLGSSSLGVSGGFAWDYSQMRYADVVYCSTAIEWPPGQTAIVTAPQWCSISLSRLFSNALVHVSIEEDAPSMKRLVGEFDERALDTFRSLLRPYSDDPTNGLFDWAGQPRRRDERVSEMRAVLVIENLAMLPFSIQDILAQGRAPVRVTLAKELSSDEATEWKRRLELP